LIQGGHRVPAGLVLLPSAFVDDRLTAEVEQWLQRELKAFPEGQSGLPKIMSIRGSEFDG
jgi:hypothetical protein